MYRDVNIVEHKSLSKASKGRITQHCDKDNTEKAPAAMTSVQITDPQNTVQCWDEWLIKEL